MPTLSHNQEVLLTRQRHEAERAGLHYDIRMVVGDLAYSWATKKEVPAVGQSIILWEQPVHDRTYALSKKVVIPPGVYGAGVTTLDWVKKGTINNPSEDPHTFSLTTKRGEKFLFKKLPEKYGDKAWLFKNLGVNKYLEKSASLIAGAVGTHVVQNAVTRAALSSPKVSKYLANSFAEGTKGVVNTSLKARAARLISGAAVPDLAVAHKTAHEFGRTMAPILKNSTKRQQVGLRMLSEGRISDLKRYGLHKDPVVRSAQAMASAKLGLKNGVDGFMKHAPKIESIFKDKSHPLASNIVKNLSRGKAPVGKNYKPGTLSSKTPLLGATASAIADPAGGALNTVKTLASSKTFGNTRIGTKINSFLENQFVKKPVKAGIQTSKLNKHISNIKHKASSILVNPVSSQLKRTSAAITDALK